MKTEGISDTELIAGLRSSRQSEQDDAIRQLYRHYYAMIEQLILKNQGTKADAADIFQEGVVVFYRKARQADFKLTASSGTFLYAVCRNLWLMRLRKQKRETELTDVHTETIAVEGDVFEYLQDHERSAWVAEALQQLKEDCRKVLIYFYFDRRRMTEIQELMNYQSPQVAKNKKSRCMQKLRELVKNRPEAKEFYT